MGSLEDIFEKFNSALTHITVLHRTFSRKANYDTSEETDSFFYKHNEELLNETLEELQLANQLYDIKGRQMILADIIEYIFLGRGYYSLDPSSKGDKQLFIKAILRFVNLLMGYEALTISDNLRGKLLRKLAKDIPELKKEVYFKELSEFTGKIGLPKDKTEAPSHLNKYFDTLLPKTAGGLWHELLVFAFLLRNNYGYILPMLLSQRLMSGDGYTIPPDFLIISKDKTIYGIEVGRKKEIQSGSFSLQTKIPTASVDTENSRVSDRCPICLRWIPFCDYVVDNYSDLDYVITTSEIRCLENCKRYTIEEMSEGLCPNMKYSRNYAKTLEHGNHEYANGLHYHYQCVLNNIKLKDKKKIIQAQDTIALKTHYPYYSGLEALGDG
ncbi:hypothetical protein ACFLWI_02470 [Chloroflexota bacterium]